MPGAEPRHPDMLPMLRGELVWLRAAEKADFMGDPPPVNDPETGHLLGLKVPVGAEGAAEFAQMVVSQQGKTMYSFTICPLGERRGIGNVTLRDIDRENGSAELSIVITDKAFQDRGYGTDAVNCIVDVGFGEIRLERIYLYVFDYNRRAIRAYEKAGFQTDATLRRSRFHRGHHHDVHLMSILRGDWLKLERRRAWDPPASGS
ncbi:MAG TPA: GNAT family protein [Candidatus Limnocylindria bacterium]|nr:GNAT family protein [Candidatus Limnocylindria bacterium]